MEFEHETEERMRREEAARRLRALADELSQNNQISFVREGRQFRVAVPEEVVYSLEVEIGEESEIEVELKW